MYIQKYKNIVIKIGSSTLMYLMESVYENDIKNSPFQNFIKDITQIMQFSNVTLVTSGAIATARRILNLPKPVNISQKQALSSIGQIYLMQEYIQAFHKYNIKAGQILLTKNDISDEKSLANLHSTLNSLRMLNAIPIINENDAISTDEIKVGDNDTLATNIALAIHADALIILTDVDGIYDSNPNENPNAILITHTSGLIEQESISETEFGSGGISTKIRAGNIAVQNNFDAIITNGRKVQPLTSIKENYCTIFNKPLL